MNMNQKKSVTLCFYMLKIWTRIETSDINVETEGNLNGEGLCE